MAARPLEAETQGQGQAVVMATAEAADKMVGVDNTVMGGTFITATRMLETIMDMALALMADKITDSTGADPVSINRIE